MNSRFPLRSCLLLALLATVTPAAWCAEETTQETSSTSGKKERPKLTSIDRLGEASRLEVHGGASFTIGGASGGGSFREYAGWASFTDPVTGIALGVSYAKFSGNGLVPCLAGFDDYDYGLIGSPSRQRFSALNDYDYGTRLHRYPGKVRGQTTDVALRLPLGKNGSSITLEASTTRLTASR